MLRQILEFGNGVVVVRNSRNGFILACCFFFIEQVVCNGILHLLPGYGYALVIADRRYIVRAIRLAVRLRRCAYRAAVAAAPGAVDGLNAELVFCVVFQVVAAEARPLQECRATAALRKYPRLNS